MSRERIMLTQAIPAVQQLRRVQGFDPLRFLKRNVNGESSWSRAISGSGSDWPAPMEKCC